MYSNISFKINICGDNAALVDDPHTAVAQMLRESADRLAGMCDWDSGLRCIRDINGNTVGEIEFEFIPEE